MAGRPTARSDLRLGAHQQWRTRHRPLMRWESHKYDRLRYEAEILAFIVNAVA